MSKNRESTDKEILRMLQLSGYRNNSKPKTTESKVPNKKLIKEDFIDNLEDAFGGANEDFGDLSTNGQKTILTPEMKVAMLANNINQYQATLLDIYKEYNPKHYRVDTPGAKSSEETDTLYDKKSTLKLRGTQDDLARLSKTQRTTLGHEKGARYDKEIEKFDKSVNLPATFIDNTEDISDKTVTAKGHLQKWFFHKDVSMISYDAKGRKLTELGKAQLEFLARAFTHKPIDEFETKLFSIFSKDKDGNHFAMVAERIIREFYSLAMIPYIMNLTKRAKYNPKDLQLKMFIENGVNDALSKLPSHYDPSRGNLGTFMITTVKNDVIDQIREISDYKVDTGYAYEYLTSIPGPLILKSIANPNEVEGVYDNVKEMGKTKSGKPIYGYVYNNPVNAISDLDVDARGGGKPSPLSLRFIYGNSKSLLYKSFPPGTFGNLKQDMDYTGEVDPYETEAIFKVETLPTEAKQTIYQILGQIVDVVITDIGMKPATTNAAGQKIPSRLGVETGEADYGYVSKDLINLLKNNKNTAIELMYELLNFGSMVEVYTQTWTMKNDKGGITKRKAGDAVVYKDGQMVPDVDGRIPGFNNTTVVWSSGSLSEEEVKRAFLEKFLAKSQEKRGIDSTETELIQKLQADPKGANAVVSAIRGGLRKFFGFEGMSEPALMKNRNKLNTIIKNYYSSMLAENKARTMIKNLLLNYINKK